MPIHFRCSRPLLFCVWSFVFCVCGCAPTDADRKSLQAGYSDYASHRLDQAQSAADSYIQKNPSAPNVDEAYYLRGIARLSRGSPSDKAAAGADLQAAITKSSRDDLKAKAYRALGDLAFENQSWQQAVEHFEKSLDHVPASQGDAHLQYYLGASLQNLGQFERARPCFDRVIALNTDPLLVQRSLTRRSATSFSLQFGAFREQSNAAELVKQLKAAPAPHGPINASITTELRDGQLRYFVRSGSYGTFDLASAASTALLPKYPRITIVP